MKRERRKFGKALILAVILVAFVTVGCAFTGVAHAATITVCPSSCDHTSIQAAIDVADPGDTIEVHSSTYYENVNVNKQLILRGVDTGGGKPVVDAGGSANVITLSADGITLEGFTATNSGNSWEDAGIKVTSTNNTITGNNASCSYNGIRLDYSSNNTITGNNVRNNNNGILLDYSSNNTITGNNASNNDYGIPLWEFCSNNIITGNNASSNNGCGIYLSYSSNNNTITGNNVSNNGCGILLSSSSSNNNITGNNVSNNKGGISLEDSSNNNTITGNTFVNDGFSVYDSYQNIVEDNTVNGKPLIYLEDTSDIEVTDAGQVILVNCNNITVENLDLSNTSVGVELYDTEDSIISNNNVCNNRRGIYLSSSSNNIITGNNVSNNDGNGIFLSKSSNNDITGNNVHNNNNNGIELYYYSCNNIITDNNACNNDYDGIILWNSCNNNVITDNNACNNDYDGISLWDSCNNNKIYLNNFINNTDNVDSSNSNNIWNSAEKIIYTYKDKTYTNYMGNHWGDYTGSDADGDGIGDTSYVIPHDNNDNYPLMEPWENYFAPTENIFDTEAPANPYPSIFGTHNGTITPSDNITVSTLYTYACAGTGGHTESIELYNETDTLIANGSWNGYIGDYHNITLHNQTGEALYVTLLKKHKYNYTIITGSYPQIIHEPSKDVTGGTITCTSFVDANGKTYTDWIPAIRLYDLQN